MSSNTTTSDMSLIIREDQSEKSTEVTLNSSTSVNSNIPASPLPIGIIENQTEMAFTAKTAVTFDSFSVPTFLKPESSTEGSTFELDQNSSSTKQEKEDEVTSNKITESSPTSSTTPSLRDSKYLDAPQPGSFSVGMENDKSTNSRKVTPQSSAGNMSNRNILIALIAILVLMSLVMGSLISCWKCSTKKEIYRFAQESKNSSTQPAKDGRFSTMQMSLLEYDEREDPELNPPSFKDVRLLMSQPCHSFEEGNEGNI